VTAQQEIGRDIISSMMPHGPAWLFIDRVVSWEASSVIRTQKLLDPADPLLRAHFKNGPFVFPGVLLVEIVGQSAYLLARLSEGAGEATPPAHLLARCTAHFLSPARGGDLLAAEVRLVERVGGVTVHEGLVTCGDRNVCRVRLFGSPLPAHGGLA